MSYFQYAIHTVHCLGIVLAATACVCAHVRVHVCVRVCVCVHVCMCVCMHDCRVCPFVRVYALTHVIDSMESTACAHSIEQGNDVPVHIERLGIEMNSSIMDRNS